MKAVIEGGRFNILHEYIGKVFDSDRMDMEREIEGRFFTTSLYKNVHEEEEQKNMVGILLLKDVTDARRKQMEMQAMYERLDQSNKELEDFAYTASHDLQAPLRKIQSFAKLLTDRYAAALTGNGHTYLARMTAAAHHMESLLNDLLSYSRATRRGSAFEKTDLIRVLHRVLSETNAAERVRVMINVPDNLPLLEVVPLQMYQLFQNLIENAIKFTKHDTQPVLNIHCYIESGEHFANLPVKPGNGYCVLRFIDEGIGFEQENAQRIFHIFQRLHGNSEYAGSGVGLAICKKIAENHGGAIFAEGRPDKGATFTVVLPFFQEIS
jgi:light-regulated signal transduction histidine kinase (bacteriophytochrome)